MEPFAEAANLAQWTLNEAQSSNAGVNDIQTFGNPGAPVFPQEAQSNVRPEEALNSSGDDDLTTVADLVFRDQPPVPQVPEVTRVGGNAGTDDSFWDLDHNHTEIVTQEIDRKIDEALALANRLGAPASQKPTGLEDLDDLDLPAFLRHGAAELPKQ